MEKLDIIIYGAGKRAYETIDVLNALHVQIYGVVDSDKNKHGNIVCGYYIQSPEFLEKYKEKKVCLEIADSDSKQNIRENILKRIGMEKNEISHSLLWVKALAASDLCKQIGNKNYNHNKYESIIWGSFYGLGLGGVQEYVKNVSDAMLNDGIQNVKILTYDEDSNIPEIIKNICIPVRKNINLLRKKDFDIILSYYEAIVNNLPCTIITSHTDSIFGAAAIAKSLFPNEIRIISMIHMGTKIVCDMQSEMSEYIDEYVVVSKWIEKNMLMRGHDNLRLVTCPFECEANLERKYNVENNSPIRIGYAGRLDGFASGQKRMDNLIKLFEELNKSNIHYVAEIAGEGPAKTQMERELNEKRLSENVHLVGLIDRSAIPSFWKSQDIAVNMSDFEGHSISQMEAMGNGAIPVVTRTSGTEDDIRDGVNGFLVDIGDYCEAAKKIAYLSVHRELLVKMGQLAHDEVYPKSLMSKHISFWRTLLNK